MRDGADGLVNAVVHCGEVLPVEDEHGPAVRRCGREHLDVRYALTGAPGLVNREHVVAAEWLDDRQRNVVCDQAMMQGEQRQLEPGGGPSLVEDVREVVFDRVLAERECPRDLSIGVARDHHFHDVALTVRQGESR